MLDVISKQVDVSFASLAFTANKSMVLVSLVPHLARNACHRPSAPSATRKCIILCPQTTASANVITIGAGTAKAPQDCGNATAIIRS